MQLGQDPSPQMVGHCPLGTWMGQCLVPRQINIPVWTCLFTRRLILDQPLFSDLTSVWTWVSRWKDSNITVHQNNFCTWITNEFQQSNRFYIDWLSLEQWDVSSNANKILTKTLHCLASFSLWVGLKTEEIQLGRWGVSLMHWVGAHSLWSRRRNHTEWLPTCVTLAMLLNLSEPQLFIKMWLGCLRGSAG